MIRESQHPGGEHMQIGLRVTRGYDGGIHEIIRLFFPRCRVTYEPGHTDLNVDIRVYEGPGYLELSGELQGLQERTGESRIFANDPGEVKREVRAFTYRLLMEATSMNPSPYGILTGVRPTKLVHRYLDNGYLEGEILRELKDKYLVEPEKAGLLTEVATRNRPFLLSPEEVKRCVGVYVGIPYCPTRCHYCSFPAYPLEHRPGLDEFFSALLWELSSIGRTLNELGLTVDNLYVGGGTPTVLSALQWEKLLDVLNRYYLGSGTEFTVEAGRPDTLSGEVLQLLAAGGVNRMCVNPQTMNDETLMRVGRRHTVRMVRSGYELVRSAGIKHINMDLIVGLPGEGAAEFMNSLQEVIRLKPESITVHHLAWKRGSVWQMQEAALEQNRSDHISDDARGILASAGYLPYYLYRQKYMAGNQENIGYALPGCFSIYNIRVIEERQTIIGLGGGAASKYVDPSTWKLTTLHYPKDPAAYIKRVEELINAQVDKLRALS